MTFTIEPQSLSRQILGGMSSKEQAEFWVYLLKPQVIKTENISALLDFISEYLFYKKFVELDYLKAEKSIRFFLLQVLQSINIPSDAASIGKSIGSTLKIPPKGKQGMFLLVTAKVYKHRRMTEKRKIKNAKIILLIHILKMLGEKALKA